MVVDAADKTIHHPTRVRTPEKKKKNSHTSKSPRRRGSCPTRRQFHTVNPLGKKKKKIVCTRPARARHTLTTHTGARRRITFSRKFFSKKKKKKSKQQQLPNFLKSLSLLPQVCRSTSSSTSSSSSSSSSYSDDNSSSTAGGNADTHVHSPVVASQGGEEEERRKMNED